MTSVIELRNITLKARGENSNSRLEQYTRARDEAFDLMTDGVMDRIKEAARNGKFRYPIYRWQNTSRFQKESSEAQNESSEAQKESEQSEDKDDTKVFFGNSSDGKNGLHIMSLINPKGIDRQHSLITKLREFFNSGSEQSANEDDRRDNQLKVYFEPHPIHFRKCAIFVSWDRKQVQRPSYGAGGEATDLKRSHVKNNVSVSERFSSMNAAVMPIDTSASAEKKRFVTRGSLTERKLVPRPGYVKRA
jgi:hypothetical protein